MIVKDLRNSFFPVPKPKELKRAEQKSEQIKQKSGQIKQKSNKLAKLERNRYSIITNDLKHCYICSEQGKKNVLKDDLHEIYGGSNRKRSIENGFVVPLCRKHHQDKTILNWLKRYAQLEYEETHSREEFIKIFGKSNIKEQQG